MTVTVVLGRAGADGEVDTLWLPLSEGFGLVIGGAWRKRGEEVGRFGTWTIVTLLAHGFGETGSDDCLDVFHFEVGYV